MGLRDLWRRLTGSGEREEKEPDTREGRSLHDARDEYEQRITGVKMPLVGDQEKLKH